MAGAKLRPEHLCPTQLVSRCNALTAITGLTVTVRKPEEAIAILSSTSLFVACCEALLGRKLQDVRRTPKTANERAQNVQAVLWELSRVLQTDLSHISSQGIVSQDPVDVYNLLEIMSALLTKDDQHWNSDDQIAAFHNSQHHHSQNHSQTSSGRMQEGETSEFGRPNPAQTKTPSKTFPLCSDVQSACDDDLSVEIAGPSPASIRPNQHATPNARQHAADDTSSSSQCSRCLDARQLDEYQDTADQPRQLFRKTNKAGCRAAGSARKVRIKRQAKKASLVMSKCYAAAVRPVLEQPDERNIREASDRHSEGSEQRVRTGQGQGPLVDPTMTAKLAHLYSLSQDNPRSSQQRQRYKTAREQAEQQRVALQKQAWLKQSLARRRVEASRQQQQLLLHSRAQAFHAKVDAIRAAQQEAEAAAAEKLQRLRRLAAQEAHLKETFLEAVEAEKERLMLARERDRDRSVQGKARGDAQKGPEGWLDVLRQHCADLEVGLAQEHQHRVRQEREKALLQQAFRQDAIRREWEQHQAQLVRVATSDDAALFRSTHSAKQHQTLKHQFRHSIRMSA